MQIVAKRRILTVSIGLISTIIVCGLEAAADNAVGINLTINLLEGSLRNYLTSDECCIVEILPSD